MIENDYESFITELEAAIELKGKPAPSDNVLKIWWRILAPYSFPQVSAALDQHIASNPYLPTPDSLIKIISAKDGRPNPEEAWALVLKTTDDADTVIWTQEMARSWAIAQPVWDSKDKIGARMAFREHYERLIANARDSGDKVRWQVSLGYDLAKRREVIETAVTKGFLPQDKANKLLLGNEVYKKPVHGLIEGSTDKQRNEKNINRFKKMVNEATSKAFIQRNEKKLAKQVEDKRALEARRGELIAQASGSRA